VDLLIVDLRMEALGGLELMAEVERRRDRGTYLPVLMLTAEASPQVKRQALARGAHDFVVKPFDSAEVLLRIRNLLGTRMLHVELEGLRRGLEGELERHRADLARREEEAARKRARVEQALRPGAIRLVYQPVFGLDGGGLLGAECLTRFEVEPRRPPNEWFAEAGEVGLGADLELASVRAAVAQLDQLPVGAFLAVNVSADVAASPTLGEALVDVDVSRLVVELTEHAPVIDYERLIGSFGALRARGARVAIDDAGAGYASFQHILRLRPDFIKLDLQLTRGIDADPARRALAAALVTFGRDIGARLIAEGVERREELEALAALGFAAAQGYYLGRPAPLPVAESMAGGS
jgi:EAL domain-containing protein (putative c-di-GMP-specific phosphodiesterase class I)